MRGILLSNDPMEILRVTPNLARITDLVNIGYHLRTFVIMLAVISMAISLLCIIVSNNPQANSENKKEISSKLIIIFITSNLVLLLNILKSVFDMALSS